MKLRAEHIRILEAVRASLSQPPDRSHMSGWCERNVVIPPPQTQSPGPLCFTGREYLREPLDVWDAPWVTDVVLCFGSQTGKTTLFQAGATGLVARSPSGILWVMPSETLAKSFSETRMIPVLRATDATSSMIPTGRDRHSFKKLQMQLGGSVLTLVGSNSPANLASRPVRVVLLDEVDKFDKGGKEEADAVNLAEQRTKSFARPLRVKSSTPTLTDGLIWQEFLKGDKRRYFVPCPCCGKSVVLIWNKHFTTFPIMGDEAVIRWDDTAKRANGEWDLDRVAQTARMQCPHCQGDIRDDQKTLMIRGGKWAPTSKTAAAGFRSYHLPSLYAIGTQTSFGVLAVKFLQAKQSLTGLQGFINGDLAEPWENQDSRAERVELVSPPEAEPLPDSKILLTADVQAASPYFWIIARAWDKAGNSRLAGAYHCDDWDGIRRIQLAHAIEDNDVIVDSGNMTETVYHECLRWGKAMPRPGIKPAWIGWLPAKGREREAKWIDKKTKESKPIFVSGPGAALQNCRYFLPLFEFNGEFLLGMLDRLRKKKTGNKWELVTFPAGLEIEGCPRVTEETYFRHIDAKLFKVRAVGRTGTPVGRWEKRSQKWPDHLLDCEIMQLASALLKRRISMGGGQG
jgi:hypothetical protein